MIAIPSHFASISSLLHVIGGFIVVGKEESLFLGSLARAFVILGAHCTIVLALVEAPVKDELIGIGGSPVRVGTLFCPNAS